MSKSVVLGNSLSALVSAAYLVKSGQQVTIIEPYSPHSAWTDQHSLDPTVSQELGLQFESVTSQHLYACMGNQWVRASKTQLEGDVSSSDQQRWPAFVALCDQASELLRLSYHQPSGAQPDVWQAWRELGSSQARDILRLPWISLKDLLNEWFDSDVLKGLLCQLSLQYSLQGPFASGTGFGLVHAWATGQALERRYTPNLEAHLRAHLQGAVKFERCSPQELKISAENGAIRAIGDFDSDLFWSAFDARRTLDWICARQLEHDTVAAVHQMRYRGCVALAQGSALPQLPHCTEQDWQAGVFMTAGLNGQERAYDPTKFGGHSPTLLGQFKTTSQGWRAQLQYHPYAQSSRQIVTGLLSQAGFGSDSLACYLPEDLQHEFGYSEGCLTGEQLVLSQCQFLRPFAHYQPGLNPFEKLHFCGPSVHPGDFGGLCARLAVQQAQQSSVLS